MNILLEISYSGKNYCGFQKQKKENSIQEEIEKALLQIFKEPITIFASGRTDSGVGAIRQVVNFFVEEEYDCSTLFKRINTLLPKDIRVLKSKRVEEDFHSRFSAKKKTYLYNFYCTPAEIPYLEDIALFVQGKLNIKLMREALQFIVGTHDFSAFCASNTSIIDKTRTIYNANIYKSELDYYTLEVTGNGFLYNMIRIIMGTLLDVGKEKITPETIGVILESKDRRKAGKTVSAKGLVLKEVVY